MANINAHPTTNTAPNLQSQSWNFTNIERDRLQENQNNLQSSTKLLSLASRLMLGAYGDTRPIQWFYRRRLSEYQSNLQDVFADELSREMHNNPNSPYNKNPATVAMFVTLRHEYELSNFTKNDFNRGKRFLWDNDGYQKRDFGLLGRNPKYEDINPLSNLGNVGAATFAVVMREMAMQNFQEELTPINPSRVKATFGMARVLAASGTFGDRMRYQQQHIGDIATNLNHAGQRAKNGIRDKLDIAMRNHLFVPPRTRKTESIVATKDKVPTSLYMESTGSVTDLIGEAHIPPANRQAAENAVVAAMLDAQDIYKRRDGSWRFMRDGYLPDYAKAILNGHM